MATRRRPGMYVLAMKLVLLAALIGSLGPGLGCSHEAKPVVAPDEHPPLPPASGSPIGHLVDDAGELKLRDDQLTKLRAIDDELGAKLAAYETELRTGEPVPDDHHPDAHVHARAPVCRDSVGWPGATVSSARRTGRG